MLRVTKEQGTPFLPASHTYELVCREEAEEAVQKRQEAIAGLGWVGKSCKGAGAAACSRHGFCRAAQAFLDQVVLPPFIASGRPARGERWV